LMRACRAGLKPGLKPAPLHEPRFVRNLSRAMSTISASEPMNQYRVVVSGASEPSKRQVKPPPA